MVSSLPTLPKPAPATIIKPPAPTTNSDDKQFVTKGELERIVNNSFSQVLDMLMSRGYFAKDTSNTQAGLSTISILICLIISNYYIVAEAGGYQSPIPLPAGPPIPPPFANASGKKPGSGNGKAGAAGAKKKAKIAFGRPAPPGPSCSSLKAGNQKKLHQPQMQPSQVLPFPAPAGQVAPTVYKFQFVMGSNNSLGHLEAATGRHVSSEAYGGGYSQQHHEMDEDRRGRRLRRGR